MIKYALTTVTDPIKIHYKVLLVNFSKNGCCRYFYPVQLIHGAKDRVYWKFKEIKPTGLLVA